MRFEDLEVRHLVGELRQEEVFSMDGDDSLQAVMGVMKQRNISAAVIKDGDKILGIVTERDFMRRGYLQGRDQFKTTVKEIMTSAEKVQTVRLHTKLVEARRVMSYYGVRHLLVIDGEGKLLNILSGRDIRDAPVLLQETLSAPLEAQQKMFETTTS